jgi:hypothetical protein
MSGEDRAMPGHILRAMLSGKIDDYEAARRSREHWERADASGGDMNALIRARLAELSVSGRVATHEATRDARGRFSSAEKASGRDGKVSMNDLVRERLRGPGAYEGRSSPETAPPASGSSPRERGDVSDRYSHLNGKPTIDASGDARNGWRQD